MASKLGKDMAGDGEGLVTQDIVDQLDVSEFHFKNIGSHGFFGSDLPVFRLRQCFKEETGS